MQIHKIVLTGGPCSGKTNVINSLKEKLKEDGYSVIIVPETAAQLIGGNINPNDNDYEHTLMFQDLVLRTQKQKEDGALEYANFIKKTDDIIIIYDRAMLDGMAYIHYESDFKDILRRNSLSEITVADKYDMVIDMVSLSSLRKDLYVTDEIRKEDSSLASILDKKTLNAWLLSDNLRVIRPRDTIEEKVEHVYNLIKNYVDKKGLSNKKQVNIDMKKSDLSVYNSSNSKKINITKYNVEILDDYYCEVYERLYDGYKSYIMKVLSKENNNLINQKNIDGDLLLEFLKNHCIKDIVEYSQINFMDSDFNVFNIETGKDFGYIKTYSDEFEIPNNIKVLK